MLTNVSLSRIHALTLILAAFLVIGCTRVSAERIAGASQTPEPNATPMPSTETAPRAPTMQPDWQEVSHGDKQLVAPPSRAADPAHAPEAGMSSLREPEWASQYIRATGSGVPPEDVKDPGQARTLAERAAEVDAKRNLLEKISAIQVDSSTCVGDYMSQHDEVGARLSAILATTKKVDMRCLDDGSVEVDLEVPLAGVWDIVKNYR